MNIKEQLQKGDIRFSINGKLEYQKCKETGEYGMYPKIFKVTKDGGSIYDSMISGMNVTKWGPTCVTLYTFDMLSKKTVGKINYNQITIVK